MVHKEKEKKLKEESNAQRVAFAHVVIDGRCLSGGSYEHFSAAEFKKSLVHQLNEAGANAERVCLTSLSIFYISLILLILFQISFVPFDVHVQRLICCFFL